MELFFNVMRDKLTFLYVKKYIETQDNNEYVLLSEDYINNEIKLNVKHKICGTEYKVSFNNFKDRESRCPFCYGTPKYNYDYIKKEIESKIGYCLLSTEYINANNKLLIKHDCGVIYGVSFSHFKGTKNKKGSRCPICSKISKRKYTYEFVKRYIETIDNNEYELLSTDYINSQSKLKIKHKHKHNSESECGFIYYVRFDSFQNGSRCPRCARENTTSKWEQEVKDYIKELCIPFIPNDRTQILNYKTNHYLELDLWFPDKMKAIECNGSYYHLLTEKIERDRIKQQQCKEKGIQLLIIKEDIWKYKREKCKEIIYNFLRG